MDKLFAFYRALVGAFPEIRTTGEFARADMLNWARNAGHSIPGDVWRNKGSARGVFVVPHDILSEIVTGEPAPIGEPSAEPIETPESVVSAQPKAVQQYVNLIPTRNPEFVPFGAYEDLRQIIKSGMFYPSYVTGLSGNGKSTMIEQICARERRELIRVNLNALSDEDQLIGSKTLEDGNVKIVEAAVLIAMRRGAVLLIDEIDAGSANSLLCLQSILEGKPYYFKLANEIITPTRGFNVIATANTKGKGGDNGEFIGTNILNEAFLERFGCTFVQDYPPQRTELKIILKRMEKLGCVDESYASCLSKWADSIRRTYSEGGVDEIMTTRRILHIIDAFAIFKSKMKAVELCCNRFDDQTKAAFIETFKAISPDDVVAVEPSEAEAEPNDAAELARQMLG